jgi:hypothetical protein
MLPLVPDRGVQHRSQGTRLRIQKLGPSMVGSRLARPRTLLPAGRAGGRFDVSALAPDPAVAPAAATATSVRGALPWHATTAPSHFGWRV